MAQARQRAPDEPRQHEMLRRPCLDEVERCVAVCVEATGPLERDGVMEFLRPRLRYAGDATCVVRHRTYPAGRETAPAADRGGVLRALLRRVRGGGPRHPSATAPAAVPDRPRRRG